MLGRVTGKDRDSVVRTLVCEVKRLPAGLMASLTWDRSTELARHKRKTFATDVHVYFCDPRSPWQRASNENTNGLLRQYFPNGTDLSVYSQGDLDAVALHLLSHMTARLRAHLPVPHCARGRVVALEWVSVWHTPPRHGAWRRRFVERVMNEVSPFCPERQPSARVGSVVTSSCVRDRSRMAETPRDWLIFNRIHRRRTCNQFDWHCRRIRHVKRRTVCSSV